MGLPAPDASGKEQGEESPGEAKPAATKAGGLTVGPGLPKTLAAPASASAASAKLSSSGGTNGASHKNGSHAKPASGGVGLLERAGMAPKWDLDEMLSGSLTRSDQFASFQTDAPSCDNCGAITVRAGNCYLCHNCGNSMGCS
jgi:ribonucleoside-diphosphate reductase alpha chain